MARAAGPGAGLLTVPTGSSGPQGCGPEALRAIPSLTGSPPALDLTGLPQEPLGCFAQWLAQALDRGVPEPLAATLSTVDADGMPDARVLLLKAVDERGWAFAGSAASRKGRQLAARPAAALSLWWQPLVRAVRVRGRVVPASPAECAADLAARSEAARAAVRPQDWRLWRLVPDRVEFWQGAPDRQHLRVVYTRTRRWERALWRGEQRAD